MKSVEPADAKCLVLRPLILLMPPARAYMVCVIPIWLVTCISCSSFFKRRIRSNSRKLDMFLNRRILCWYVAYIGFISYVLASQQPYEIDWDKNTIGPRPKHSLRQGSAPKQSSDESNLPSSFYWLFCLPLVSSQLSETTPDGIILLCMCRWLKRTPLSTGLFCYHHQSSNI